MHDLIRQRARHFGAGDRHGMWLFAADVACCVSPRAGGGSAAVSSETAGAKVSARTFAGLSGRGPATVLRYLKTWDRAAEAGLVRPAAELMPGDEPDLPDADRWKDYYRSGREPSEPSEADDVHPDPAAMREAILADPQTADAAWEAINQLNREARAAERAAMAAEEAEHGPSTCSLVERKLHPGYFADWARLLLSRWDDQQYDGLPFITVEQMRAMTAFRPACQEFIDAIDRDEAQLGAAAGSQR